MELQKGTVRANAGSAHLPNFWQNIFYRFQTNRCSKKRPIAERFSLIYSLWICITCHAHLRYSSTSISATRRAAAATCLVLSAASQRLRPFSMESSSRMRPT